MAEPKPPACCIPATSLVVLLLITTAAPAEVPAPSVHWGALAYPDTADTLDLGYVNNYFTVFGKPTPYNPINQTMGFNFVTLTWTQHWQKFEGWSTNLTVGGGPTDPHPGQDIQNLIHDTLHYNRVRVGLAREADDFMIDGSVTKWISLGNTVRSGFAGLGVSSGSIYHEGFARIGVRKWTALELRPAIGPLRLSLSAMGRYGQLGSASAFHQVAPQAYLGQVSFAVGWYNLRDQPKLEFEGGLTFDSGLFVGFHGEHLEEHFGAVVLRFWPGIAISMWNDSWGPPKGGAKDNGPTGGGMVLLDVYRIAGYFTK
jgi:hypothetical protein